MAVSTYDLPRNVSNLLALTDLPIRVTVNMYITKPNASASAITDTAVLYLTDVFGINLTENRL